MQDNHTNLIGRRPVLKGAGVALAGLGGLTGAATASHENPTPLTDKEADILVYWSQVRESDTDPDELGDFGFPYDENPNPPGGPAFATHDPAGPQTQFNFGNIVMSADHSTLTNGGWVILGGALVKQAPLKTYQLNYQGGGGLYASVGQEDDFQARSHREMKNILGLKGKLPHPFHVLSGKSWHAVGFEYARLELDGNGDPNPEDPKWGATRIDFYQKPSGKYRLSLIYLIAADGTKNPADGVFANQELLGYTASLVNGGRLTPGSV